jgi:DNA-binding transcriptional ArsR family regulator
MTTGSDDADRLWASVGDPIRIVLLDLLLERGEATASTLAGALPISRQGVSKHLAVLDREGLVTTHRSGREVRYTVQRERLDQASAAMARTAARWDKRLTAIKKMAEQTSPGQ